MGARFEVFYASPVSWVRGLRYSMQAPSALLQATALPGLRARRASRYHYFPEFRKGMMGNHSEAALN
ncbi:hypothetical protein RRG08_055446 [Elysia crispata]|uniref:Uncharacterized protein n=1 Tax=Elysia crispata TaxID=231223 RepID=A0AAE1DVZ8_9GAST|nr:hypothetical protein RRG08_055446 [Elysia crispata]